MLKTYKNTLIDKKVQFIPYSLFTANATKKKDMKKQVKGVNLVMTDPPYGNQCVFRQAKSKDPVGKFLEALYDVIEPNALVVLFYDKPIEKSGYDRQGKPYRRDARIVTILQKE